MNTTAPANTITTNTPAGTTVRYRLPWVAGWLEGTYTGRYEARKHMVTFYYIEQADGTTVKASIAQAI